MKRHRPAWPGSRRTWPRSFDDFVCRASTVAHGGDGLRPRPQTAKVTRSASQSDYPRACTHKSAISASPSEAAERQASKLALPNGPLTDISADDAGGSIDLRFVPGGEAKKEPPLSCVVKGHA